MTSPLDASSKRFVRRFTEGLSRFDDVVICEDCNTADAAAKKIVDAPPHFTFTPTEIAGSITVTPNQVHGIDEANLRFIYAIAFPQFETRKRSADHLADRVLGGTHWHEHVEWSDRPESIDRAVEAMMRVLGFRDAAHWSVAERLLLPPSDQKADHTRWRTRERTAATKPTANEAEYIVRCHARHWNSVPEHWRCPACNRPRYDIIRSTKQFKWMFVLDEARFAAIDAPLGEAKVVICDACRQAMKDFNQEARHDPKIGARSAPYLSLADLRQMVRPQAHGLRNIDNVAANMLLTALQRASEGSGSDDYC